MRLRHARQTDGFTLVEVMVAMAIMAVVLVGLAYTVTRGLTNAGLARQRTTSTGLANGVMEEVRAMPYDTVRLGLNRDDAQFQAEVADPNGRIKDCPGGLFRFESCSAPAEQIVTHVPPATPSSLANPLVPHARTVTPDPNRATRMTRRAYVTRVTETDTRAENFRVTVVVEADSGSLRSGVDAGIRLQTLIFSPPGCLSTATNPFAAPCEPFFMSQGAVPQGTISVAGSVAGVPVPETTIFLTEARSAVQAEQVRRANGSITAPLVAVTDQPPQGGESRSSAADDDVGTGGAPPWDQQTLSSAGAPSVVADYGPARVTATSSSGVAVGSTTSTVSAVSPARECPKSPPASVPASQNDSQPCAYSIPPAVGAYQISLRQNLAGLDLDFPLARVVPQSQPTSFTDHTKTSTQERTGTALRREFSSIQLIALPGSLGGVLAGTVVNVSSATSTANAVAGQGAAAPAATNSGTATYWDASPGITANATLSTAPATHAVSRTLTIPDVGSIEVTGSFTLGGTFCNPAPCNAPETADRTEVEATVDSPLKGQLGLVIRDTVGTVVTDLTITIDVGPMSSRGTYRPAP